METIYYYFFFQDIITILKYIAITKRKYMTYSSDIIECGSFDRCIQSEVRPHYSIISVTRPLTNRKVADKITVVELS